MTHTTGPAKLWGLTFTRALGLILVPLVIAGVFLWGLWDPTSRLDRVTAAVVNNDEPVEVDGQLTPLGRVFAAELIGTTESENFRWELTNTEGAEEGLTTGEYVTVVTIPENFSARATSLADGPDGAGQAIITVETSERAKLLDAALSAAVTQTATQVLNTQLGEAFVGNVFVGFTELGEGLDGASEGASQLADGADKLADGATQLADGLSEFAAGTGQLQGGVFELSAGTSQLAEGLNTYTNGVQEYAHGTRAAATGSQQLAEGVENYVGTINGVLNPLLGGINQVTPQIGELRQAIVSDELPVPEDRKEQILSILDQALEAPAMLELAITGGDQLAQGVRASANGLVGLADGAQGLADGARDITGGAQELALGTEQLAAQLPGLSAGAHELASGAGELADGTVAAADGSHELADGLAEAVSQIPRYTDSERDMLAELAVNPVGAGDREANLFSGSGAPLFLSVALWAGALAMFMLMAPLWARTREAALSEASITLRSAGPGMAIASLQGVIAAVSVGVFLNAHATEMLAYALTGLLVGVAFALVNQGLVALFRGYGRFVAFVIMTLAFVAGIVSTAPAILASVTRFTPIGTAIGAFQNIEESGAPGLGATLMLLVWAGLGVVLLGAAVHRRRLPVLTV